MFDGPEAFADFPSDAERSSGEVHEQAADAPGRPSPPATPRDDVPREESEDWGSPRIIHRPIPASELDRDAVVVIRRLTRQGHTAYLVGGCVRDLLLATPPKDFDIATSARPRQVKRVFRNCRIIGRRFRLAHVIFGTKIIEVSTFRCGATASSPEEDLLIREDNVFGTPEEDARRRDFTINGLFYDIQQGTVIDYVGGLHDIERRTVRTIGDPEIRFQEDPIRILRAVKFAARLNLHISPKTMEAIERHRDKIPRSAPPRILEELLRMGRGGASWESFELMRTTGILAVVLPDVARGIDEQPDRLDRIRRHLEALDARVRTGFAATAPIIFGIYLLPLVYPDGLDALAPEPVRADGVRTEHRIENLLQDIIPRLHLPRRDAGRLRQILMAQRRLVPAPRRRRFSRTAVARQAYFPEALALLEIQGASIESWTEEIERWRAALDRLPKASPASRPRTGPEDRSRSVPGEPGAGGRRRKRRPRRRRRKPAPPDAG